MQTITMIKTAYDGELHKTQKDAQHHLDKIYADKLCKIGHELGKCDGKYIKMCDFVDGNLHLFIELHSIKADMKLTVDPDEEQQT